MFILDVFACWKFYFLVRIISHRQRTFRRAPSKHREDLAWFSCRRRVFYTAGGSINDALDLRGRRMRLVIRRPFPQDCAQSSPRTKKFLIFASLAWVQAFSSGAQMFLLGKPKRGGNGESQRERGGGGEREEKTPARKHCENEKHPLISRAWPLFRRWAADNNKTVAPVQRLALS